MESLFYFILFPPLSTSRLDHYPRTQSVDFTLSHSQLWRLLARLLFQLRPECRVCPDAFTSFLRHFKPDSGHISMYSIRGSACINGHKEKEKRIRTEWKKKGKGVDFTSSRWLTLMWAGCGSDHRKKGKWTNVDANKEGELLHISRKVLIWDSIHTWSIWWQFYQMTSQPFPCLNLWPHHLLNHSCPRRHFPTHFFISSHVVTHSQLTSFRDSTRLGLPGWWTLLHFHNIASVWGGRCGCV